jgi:hypothetical protein
MLSAPGQTSVVHVQDVFVIAWSLATINNQVLETRGGGSAQGLFVLEKLDDRASPDSGPCQHGSGDNLKKCGHAAEPASDVTRSFIGILLEAASTSPDHTDGSCFPDLSSA